MCNSYRLCATNNILDIIVEGVIDGLYVGVTVFVVAVIEGDIVG